MAQTDGGGGPDFDLADEILAVIPTDPYDQLDLARKITSMAIASPVSTLEAEAGRMRQKLNEKDQTIGELQERVSHAQRARQEAESRLKISLDENTKLVAERDSLSTTIKKLSRDLAKLETFRRQLMQSLNDDTSSQAETDDIGTCDQSIPRAYPDKDEGTNGYTTQISLTGATDISSTIDKAPSQTAQRFSITPYVTPRLTPTGTPTSVSPRVYSAIGSPRKSSSMASPSKSHYDGRTTLSSWYTTSQHSSAGNSPRSHSMQERASRIDGREFFRQARTRLSYEQFSAFLANIKELNAQKQTREETLRKAEELFGMDNKDLYLSFQGLLNCSSH